VGRKGAKEIWELNLFLLKQAIKAGRIEWRKHVLQRMAERDISRSNVLHVLSVGELIEDYPEDKPFASALFLGFIEGEPLHVVAALDDSNQFVYIITAYTPSLEFFESDFKTRRSK
jgi:hypothetical protein